MGSIVLCIMYYEYAGQLLLLLIPNKYSNHGIPLDMKSPVTRALERGCLDNNETVLPYMPFNPICRALDLYL